MLARLLSVCLTILVLFGAIGLPVSRHYCMGELKSVAYFGEAEKCYEKQHKPHCPFHPAPIDAEEDGEHQGCCEDEYEILRVDDQEQPTVDVLPSFAISPPALPPLLINYLPPHLRPRPNANFENYHPPPLLTDARLEFQVFRI